MAAILAVAGLGERWLEARWPDDRAILGLLAQEIDDLEHERAKNLANMVAVELARAGR